MPRITNRWYRQFLDTGVIELVRQDEFAELLARVEHKHQTQARALTIILYITGRRPSEVLDLTGQSVQKVYQSVQMTLTTRKGGAATLIELPLQNPLIAEFWDYAKEVFPTMYLFWAFRGRGKTTTDKLRYWFRKWSCGMERSWPPYFFRHNRFSTMAQQGATPEEIKYLKGARTLASVEPYLHLSTARAKKLKKYFKA